jgi:hypothetical protein
MCEQEEAVVDELTSTFPWVTPERIRAVVRSWVDCTQPMHLGADRRVVVEFAARGQLWRERRDRSA